MKCSAANENVRLLLENETDSFKRLEIKGHLSGCESCRAEFETQRRAQEILKKQPTILPSASFDNRMLRAFEEHVNAQEDTKSGWFASFAFLKPALAVALFAFAVGAAFQLGRLSVSSATGTNSVESQSIDSKEHQRKTPPTTIEKVEALPVKPEVKFITKTVTKFVEVPVIKEKIVTRISYADRPRKNKRAKKENKKLSVQNDKDIASQFNLKDLKPVVNVTYKIIRKGEDDEK